MTLCIGVVCVDKNTGLPAIIFASDGQLTLGPIRAKTSKLISYHGRFEEDPHTEPEYRIQFALAGDAYVAEEAFFKIIDVLDKKIPVDVESPAVELLNIKEEIGDIVFEVYSKYFDRCEEKPWFELLIGSADEIATLLHVNAEGKSHYSSDYAMIGRGVITGGMMMLNEFHSEDMSIDHAIQLSVLILLNVGAIDTSVGQDIEICVCTNKSGYIFEDEELDSIVTEVKNKWNLIKDVFWEIDRNPNIEKYLKRTLKS